MRAAGAWQSMESAPKDGSWILIYYHHTARPRSDIVRWDGYWWGNYQGVRRPACPEGWADIRIPK